MSVVNTQVERRARIDCPKFLPAAMSTNGFVSKHVIELQEFLVGCYKSKLAAEGSRRDGMEGPVLIANYRHRFRVSVQVVLAKGLARIQESAGTVFTRSLYVARP